MRDEKELESEKVSALMCLRRFCLHVGIVELQSFYGFSHVSYLHSFQLME